ncbi:hypothetical protein HA402_006131 [Bradysia odoriphaga]|nr:hypothetical protein HA402_006131 [Bradysia odoriphaga]
MDIRPPIYEKNSFGMKCMKIILILINVLYLIISFLMISGATTLKVIFGEHYFELWYASTVDSLSSLWIATGVFLLALSIFGIAAAVKESTMMTNFYGLFLSLIFILQMAAAITGFTLITQADGIVWGSLNSMMYQSQWGYESTTMDWIQQTFKCCGNNGPSDWESFGRYATTTPRPTYDDWYYTTRPYTDWWGEITTEYETTTGYETTPSTTTEFLGNRMPQSCCVRDSAYNKETLRCDYYFTRGCHGPLNQIVSQSVMIWGSSALFIGIIQILGVINAFMFARIIRRNKTNRDVHRWAIHESLGVDRPTYVDQLPNTDEVKHM